jgi:hypothetical protein
VYVAALVVAGALVIADPGGALEIAATIAGQLETGSAAC